jgi:hypothetical protein
MKTEDVKLFLQDITFNSAYKFLEQGQDDKEIEDVTKRHNIDVGNDLAILKIEYAYTDRFNKNGCRLPKDEVIKALGSIKGRILDEDHLRKAVRGFMIEGKVVGSTIIVYAAFFKSSFPERYDLLKEMISQKELAVSFEAYGKRNFVNANQFDLVDISFAGCGLLYTTNPAFEGARVLEAAKVTEQVLEFATEFKSADDLLHVERARYHMFDIFTVSKMIDQTTCPECKSMGAYQVDEIDFKGNKAECTCMECNCEYKVNLTPQTTPMEDEEDEEEDSSVDDIKDKKNKSKVEENTMNEAQIKELNDKVLALETSEKALKLEVATLTEALTKANKDLTDAKEQFEKEKTTAIEEALVAERASVEKAKVISARKTELGEFAKDLKDEEILDDVKFENAKLKKENAELKKVKAPITAKIEKEETLEVGSKSDEVSSEIFKVQDKIKELAFSK